jgi:hypothetical protein
MNQPYNPYPQPGAPATGYPQQQQPTQPATVPMQQTQAGVWAPVQQVQQQPQQQAGMMPVIHMPDDALVQQAFARAAEEQARIARIRSGQGGGGDLHWFSPLGPAGEPKWGANVPIGYEASYVIWLLPPWAAGMLNYVDDPSHFYRTQEKPQGTGITCAGNGCWVCAARNAMFKTGSEVDAKKAQDAGKLSKRAIYQILLLEHYQSHFTPDGRFVPWLFRAPGGLHTDIWEKIKTRTLARIVHPQYGRPLILKKKKKGSNNFDIDWSIDDLDPRPLDQYFYPAFQNLYDLTKFVKQPTLGEQYQAIIAMGFPVPQQLPALVQQEQAQLAAQGQQGGLPQQQPMLLPQGQQQMQVPQQQPAYSPAPNAPAQNPYGGYPTTMGQPPGQPVYAALPPQQPAPGGIYPAQQGQPVATTFQHGPGHTGTTAPGQVYMQQPQQQQQQVPQGLQQLQTQMRG